MKNFFYTGHIYLLFLTLFFVIHFNNKVKPRIRLLNLIGFNSEIVSPFSKNEFINISPIDSRVNVGETLKFRDNTDWYQVSLLSFWREEYLSLDLLNKSFEEDYLEIKMVNSNNYALGTFKNENIVYACLDRNDNFYYNLSKSNVPRAGDLKHWKEVFIKEIKNVIFSFKPNNNECLLVITSNIDFFKASEEGKRKLIFNKFIDTSKK